MSTEHTSDASERVAGNAFLESLKEKTEVSGSEGKSAIEEFGSALGHEDIFEDLPENILAASGGRSIDQLMAGTKATKPSDASPRTEAKPKAKAEVAEDKPKKKDGVRFNNLSEAEKEVRKLQSERDRLAARNRELSEAEILMKDIQSDPALAQALTAYYQTGEFAPQPTMSRASSKDTGIDFDGFDELGDGEYLTKEQVKEALTKKERKENAQRRLEEMKKVREQQWLDAQYSAFKESHPDVGEADFQRVIQFAQDPKNVTLDNIYTLMNQDEIVNERVRIAVEQAFKGRGREIPRQSIVQQGGGGDDEDVAPDPMHDIMNAAKKMRRFG
jgi:hypothetical protein